MKKKKNQWKQLFLKCFDINSNGKVDKWEILVIIGSITLFQLAIQVGGNWIYDKMFTHNLDTPKIEQHEKN